MRAHSRHARTTLFTRGPTECAACHWVRRWLERHDVGVREADIVRDGTARAELQRLTNADLPVPTVALPDGRVVVWPGPATLQALFGGHRGHDE